MPHRDGVAAVDRALALLETVGEAHSSLSLSELARATGLVKSTALRLAASLERAAFLRRGSDGRYRLGPALARLGACYQASFDLGQYVQPALARLAERTGESASFYVREGDERVCLHRVNAPRDGLLHVVHVGTRFPYDTGAAGRVLHAFSEPNAQDRDGVRETVVAVSVADRTLSDTAALAAPVFGADGAFVGAISLVGPASRFGERALPALRREVLDAAREVNSALGTSLTRYEHVVA